MKKNRFSVKKEEKCFKFEWSNLTSCDPFHAITKFPIEFFSECDKDDDDSRVKTDNEIQWNEKKKRKIRI